MPSTYLTHFVILALTFNEATTSYKEVLINATTKISCIPNEDIQIQWIHTALDGSINYVYAGGGFYASPNRGFSLDKDSNIGPYHLVIPHARDKDAGLYECKEDSGSRLFGSTQLTVLESSPDCGLDMKPGGYVGPSTCNLEQEDMTFTCIQRFYGKPPLMIWTTVNDSQSFEESMCNVENVRMTCSLITKADSKYDGSTFSCQSIRSTAECRTENITVQYFESQLVDENPPVVVKSVGDKVNCSVESNQKLEYKWTRFLNKQHQFKTKDQEVLIDEPGLHRCYVDYRIRNVPCEALVIEVNVHNPITTTCEPPKATALTSGTTGTTAISVLSTFVFISIVVIIVLGYCFQI